MIRAILVMAVFWAGLWTIAGTAANASEPAILNNPFSRPAVLAQAPPLEIRATAETESQPETVPVLSATLASEASPMAIFDGALMTIGQQHEGYRLVSVEVGSAVFEKEDKEIRLQVMAVDKESRKRR